MEILKMRFILNREIKDVKRKWRYNVTVLNTFRSHFQMNYYSTPEKTSEVIWILQAGLNNYAEWYLIHKVSF